tara:strand:- start:265 stop:1119 length:855 start_codon:yes stop_codon:yes gene_type:complete
MILLDGKKLSFEIDTKIKERVIQLKKRNIIPGIGIILVGDNLESKKYISMKEKKCKELGMHFSLIHLKEDITEDDILSSINTMNGDTYIHGIIVQLPLPKQFNPSVILNKVSYEKDVDGFHKINAGELYQNINPSFVPCTPLGCIELLNYYNIDVKGLDIVIIGASKIVGLPLALLLLQKEATVTICHIETKDIIQHTKNADIVISCCGVPNLVKKHWIKDDVIIIDIGITVVDGKIIGDVDFEDVKDKVKYITPVPGGVGPMTVSMLMYQTVTACEKLINLKL